MARTRAVGYLSILAINLLYILGKDVKKLAKEYNVSERTIYRYVKSD